MEELLNLRIRCLVYSVVLDLILWKSWTNVNTNNADLVEKLRLDLMTDLEQLQSSLDIMTKKDLHIAISLIRSALAEIKQYNFEEANRNFAEAQSLGKRSFESFSEYPDKSLAMRIQILCTLMTSQFCYLISVGEACNRSQLQDDLQALFKSLSTLPMAAAALRDEFEGRNVFNVMAGRLKLVESSRASRSHILHDLAHLNLFFELHFDLKFPVWKSATEMVDLSEVKDVLVARSTTQICCFAMWRGLLITGCGDNTVTVYDLSTFAKVNVLRGHSFFVEVLLVQDNVLYSSSYDRMIIMWDLLTMKGAGEILGASKMVSCLAVCNNAQHRTLFSGSVGDDSYLKVWNLNTLTEMRKPYLGAFFWVFAVVCHENRLYVSSTWYRNTEEELHFHCITVWDVAAPTAGMPLLGILKGHHHNIKALSIQDELLYSASCDKTLILWDYEQMELHSTIKDCNGEVNSVAVHHHRLFAGDEGKIVRQWNLLSGERQRDTLTMHDFIKTLAVWEGRLFVLAGGVIHVVLL